MPTKAFNWHFIFNETGLEAVDLMDLWDLMRPVIERIDC